MKYSDSFSAGNKEKTTLYVTRRRFFLDSLLSFVGLSMTLARPSEAAAENMKSNQYLKGHCHEDYMKIAISVARQVPEYPFGSVIVDQGSGEVIATGFNRVAENPIFHGEIDAINQCAHVYHSRDWSNLSLYTTAEPCPMCQSAIEWCGIQNVYYGTSIPYLKQLGWKQIDIRAEEVARRTPFRKTKVVGGILEAECNDLFETIKKASWE
ncbi:nucleoside deaminase [Endozoicomonas atrinae]|uniref:nucleoside deaminase n=2 Tax=Endozoicomonas atrinae TaxID=1333660 RepID=UPI003B00D749